MKRYRLSPVAQLDLEEIWLYVAQDSGVALADRLVHEIARGLDLLAAHPDAGRARDEIAAGRANRASVCRVCCTASGIKRPCLTRSREVLAVRCRVADR